MKKLTRRSVIASAAAATVASKAGAAILHRGGVASGGGGGGLPALTMTLTFPGGTPAGGPFIFDIANGTDMGSYTAPTAGFTQRCIRCRNALVPHMFVDFRPDASGGRIEAVVWNGETDPTGVNVASNYFRNLPEYTAVLKLSGVAQADWLGVTTRTIQRHPWGARWRFQSAVRSVIRTAAQVFSDGFLPHMSQQAGRISGTNVSTGKPWSGLPYSDVASGGSVIIPPAPTVPTPSTNDGTNGDGSAMTSGPNGYVWQPFMVQDPLSTRLWGIKSHGDDGGFRPELGLITEWQGDWLLNGTASSLNTILQQAEYFASQAGCWFLPDAVTGACINTKSDITHYLATTFDSPSGYTLTHYSVQTGGWPCGNGSNQPNFVSGSISGTTLTVGNPSGNGLIKVGMTVTCQDNTQTVAPGTLIVNQLTGSTGLAGTYTVSISQTSTASGGFLTIVPTFGEYRSKGDEHSPQICYLPYVLTEDPYYIEAEQYRHFFGMATATIYQETDFGNLNGDSTGASGFNGAFTMSSVPFEERMVGWGIKNTVNNWVMAPGSPPSWLLPKSYYAAVSSDYSKVIDVRQFNNPTDPFYTAFHSISIQPKSSSSVQTDTPQTFYKAYACSAIALAVKVGMTTPTASGQTAPSTWATQLDYVFDWMRNVVDPAVSSGWNTGDPLCIDLGNPYFMSNVLGPPSGCSATPNGGAGGGQPIPGNNCNTTYAQLWTAVEPFLEFDSGGSPLSPYWSDTNVQSFVGGLSAVSIGNLALIANCSGMAKSVGLSGAAAVFAQINAMIDYSLPRPLSEQQNFTAADGFDGT